MARLKLTTDKIAQLETYVKLGLPTKDIFSRLQGSELNLLPLDEHRPGGRRGRP